MLCYVFVSNVCVCIHIYMNVKVVFHTLGRKFIGKKIREGLVKHHEAGEVLYL